MTVNRESVVINNNNRDFKDELQKRPLLPSQIGTDYNYKHKIVWFNAIGFLYLHLVAVYGVYLCLTGRAHILTTIWSKYYYPIKNSTINKCWNILSCMKNWRYVM